MELQNEVSVRFEYTTKETFKGKHLELEEVYQVNGCEVEQSISAIILQLVFILFVPLRGLFKYRRGNLELF